MSSLQATVISGLPSRHHMCSTKRLLPQPVGPFNISGMRNANAVSNSASSLPTLR